MTTLEQRIAEHRNEWIVVEQVRPDTNAAPTGMVAVDSQSYVNEYGETVNSPTGWNYLTEVSANDRGETLTALSSVPVTIDGTTYVHTMTVSDRTCGPMLFGITITGTGAQTLDSWICNARMSGDSGTGTSYQPNELYDVGEFGADDYYRHNPTRDGESAAPYTPGCVSGFPPTPMPYRDTRVHSSKPIYYEASGETFKSCVHPMEFSNNTNGLGDVITPCAGTGVKGNTNARSTVWYGHRMFQQIQLRWGSTLAVQATTHRCDTWSYAPVDWDETNTTGPMIGGLSQCCTIRGGLWNEATIYDLADGSTYPVPAAVVSQIAGVSNFLSFHVTRRFLLLYESSAGGALTLVAGIIRNPVASPYVGVVLRNSVTNLAIATVVKLGEATTGGPGEVTELAQEYINGLPDLVVHGSFWDGPYATVPADIEQAYSIGSFVDSRGLRRRRGWIGNVIYRCVGLTEHVVAAMQGLYTSGDLDDVPVMDVPSAVRSGTLWPYPPYDQMTLRDLRERTLERWERSQS